MSATTEQSVSPERVQELIRREEEAAKARIRAQALLPPEPDPEPEPPHLRAKREEREREDAHQAREEPIRKLADERGLTLRVERAKRWDGSDFVRDRPNDTYRLVVVVGHRLPGGSVAALHRPRRATVA